MSKEINTASDLYELVSAHPLILRCALLQGDSEDKIFVTMLVRYLSEYAGYSAWMTPGRRGWTIYNSGSVSFVSTVADEVTANLGGYLADTWDQWRERYCTWHNADAVRCFVETKVVPPTNLAIQIPLVVLHAKLQHSSPWPVRAILVRRFGRLMMDAYDGSLKALGQLSA